MQTPKEIFTYDLMAKLRSDSAAASRVQKTIDDLSRIQRLIAEGKAEKSDMSRVMGKLVIESGFNYGLLFPYIFPNFADGNPLSLVSRPFMFVMTSLASNYLLTLRAGRQVGKCVSGDTELETNQGIMTIRQLYEKGNVSSAPTL